MVLILSSCVSKKLNLGVIDNNDKLPYVFKGSQSYRLPRGISKKIESGKVIVHVFINKNGSIKGFNIPYLSIKKDSGGEINFRDGSLSLKNRDEYPYDVVPFWDFIAQKIITQDMILETEGISKENDYLLTIPMEILD